MKKLAVGMLVITSAVTAFCQEHAAQVTKKPRLTPEQRAERRLRRTGGEIVKPMDTKHVEIVNTNYIVPTNAIVKAIASVNELLTYPFKQVPAATKDPKVAMRIEIVDCDKCDQAIMIFPEKPGAKINIRPLKADSPAADVFAARVGKEVWRAFAYGLGAGNSTQYPSVLKPTTSLADLDANKSSWATPDAFNQMIQMANKIGLFRQEVYTYKQACEEGWAPPPANDIQKAVWEKVKAAQSTEATKGIEIKFDPKKGK